MCACVIRFYSGAVIIAFFFFFVNRVDLFSLMLFSAKTIKVNQACISADLVTLWSSLD